MCENRYIQTLKKRQPHTKQINKDVHINSYIRAFILTITHININTYRNAYTYIKANRLG